MVVGSESRGKFCSKKGGGEEKGETKKGRIIREAQVGGGRKSNLENGWSQKNSNEDLCDGVSGGVIE